MKPRAEDFQWIQDLYLMPDPKALSTDNCPDLDDLSAAAAGQLPPRQRRDILDHAVGCVYCLESWQIALKLGDSRVMTASTDPPHRTFRDRHRSF